VNSLYLNHINLKYVFHPEVYINDRFMQIIFIGSPGPDGVGLPGREGERGETGRPGSLYALSEINRPKRVYQGLICDKWWWLKISDWVTYTCISWCVEESQNKRGFNMDQPQQSVK